MRGSFNDSFTVRYGSRSVVGTSGDVWGVDVPCRKVPQRAISQHQSPFDLAASWVTVDEVGLHGPYTLSPWIGAIFSDYLASDQVLFQSEPSVWYVVCREELVVPDAGGPYSRFLLVPLSKFADPFWPPREPLPSGPLPKMSASCDGVSFDGLISQELYLHFGRSPSGLCSGDFASLNGETVGPMVWDGVEWRGEPQLGFTVLSVRPNWVDAGRPVVNTCGVTVAGFADNVTGLSPSHCCGFRLSNRVDVSGTGGTGAIAYTVDDNPF